jgi:hypothetical protein
MSHEGVKLRLRGRGSGFLEGPEQKESNDPLNLCVSSKDKEKYLYACQEVERLLERVYQEYRFFDKGRFCKSQNMYYPLQIKKEESITGPKSLFDTENKDQIRDILLQKSKSVNSQNSQMNMPPQNSGSFDYQSSPFAPAKRSSAGPLIQHQGYQQYQQ